MDALSNQIPFFTLTGIFVATKLASGLAINTDSVICAGGAHGSCITDVLIRNQDSTNARIFEVIFCATGTNSTVEHRVCQITVPANSGNSTIALTSLAALVPQLFDLDLAGNRGINVETGWSMYLRNAAALTGDVYVNVKLRGF